MKIKVVTTNNEIKTIKGTKDTLEAIEYELSGKKGYIEEYETIDREIITDIEILTPA